ncbi:outer membrane beta-barrel protein [Flammeovirga sp. SubArs3]|uniref:outer membrane beta-barrel protein n=1 Tax=Flammeovirga sp. SubArs3 TaxID=2995316 RepID=UPI00248AB3F8|nr:outer membrane beta-barrel protein [Flammeovirga sp. SubArs3]
MQYRFILFLCLFFFVQTITKAQEEIPKPTKYLEIGPAIGSYRGDLSPNYSKVNGGVNVGYIFNKERRWNFRLDFSYLYVQGQILRAPDYIPPLTEPYPNDYFQSHTFNTSLSVMFNIINKDNFKVYIAQGIGLFYYNPMDENGEELIENISDPRQGYYKTRNDGEDYTNFALSLPTRFGVNYFFPTNFGVGVSATFANIFTDYLDNVSELGNVKGNDNLMSVNFSFFIPLQYQKLNRVK